MSSDPYNEEINTVSSGAVAGDASLMATFYCRRGAEATGSLYRKIYSSLSQGHEVANLDFWQSPDKNTFLRRFDPPAAHDTTVIQLARNSRGDITSAWDDMQRRVENLMCTTDLPSAWWGYTLTYQAALPLGADYKDLALKELRSSARRLCSSESLYPLAQVEMLDGKVWLLRVPLQDDGLAAATVYLALCPSDKEEVFVRAVISGPEAALFMPDLVAHKAYHQMRQYRSGDLQRKFEERITDLQQTTNQLLISDSDQTVETDDGLENLARGYPRLIPVVSALKELHVSLVRQSRNYDQWRAPIKNNAIIEYHRGHIEMATSEVDLLVTQCQDAIDTADRAVSIAQVQVSKAQANRQWWIATLLGVVGLAVSLRGILAWEGVEELLGQFPILEQYSGNFFVKLGTQIGIILISVFLLVLVVSWIRKRGRKKRISERE